MAGFQTIFDISQSIGVNNRRVIGQQISRSGQMTVAQYLTTVPFSFIVKPHNYLYYPDVRSIIQQIDNLDRQYSEVITFDTDNLRWFTAMKGTATAAITSAPVPPNTQIIGLNINGTLKAGDFIMVAGYPYKVTQDAIAGTSVGVYINRPLINVPNVGDTVLLGNAVTFNLIAEKCPSYTLTPMANGAFVEWDSEFIFREYITG
jgi:hypothetical protein